MKERKVIMKPLKFLREVRGEMAKVTWPTMASTRMFTIGVFILAFIAGAYLWGVDLVLSAGVRWIIGA